MTLSLRALPLALLALSGSPVAIAQATERMPYAQSAAIKRSLLPPGGMMRDYELDHCRPLCLGGSNDRSNLQLQPWPEARRKDADEVAACKAVARGEISQDAAAVELARQWPCAGR